MPTSKDVAALAGVSQSTVSYVMSGKRSISEKTRVRVQAAIDELTYHPNAGARALAGSRTNVLSLVVKFSQATDAAGLLPFVETITTQARVHDYDVVLVTADEGSAGLLRLAGRRICDAVILMDVREIDERVAVAARLPVPAVLIGSPEDVLGLDAVDTDMTAAGALAVGELVSTGHDRIVVIGESPEVNGAGYPFVRAFEDGARSSAERGGVPLQVVHPAQSGWGGLEAVADLILDVAQGRLGVITRTPQVTGWLLQLMAQRGLVPGVHLSLVALCTDESAISFGVHVTNVSPEPHEVSRRAVEAVLARIEGQPASGSVRLVQPRLTRRATTLPR